MNLTFAIERLRSVLRRQHKALSTESSYIYWLRQYVTALNGMPDSLASEQKLERFLTGLARHRDLSASSQNQAFNAILFFYKEVLDQPLQGIDALRAKRPVHLRHAPTVAETQALLQTVRDRAGCASVSCWPVAGLRFQSASVPPCDGRCFLRGSVRVFLRRLLLHIRKC